MPSYDYVIVGAGSAGCVLAARLAEDPSTRVLVLEAGVSDRHPNVMIPAAFGKQFHTKLDWDFATEPEPGAHGRSLYMPRGKSLGGSSSMNAMLYVRGRPADYDGWERDGATGWGWDDVLPYFKKSERYFGGDSDLHGGQGPLEVSKVRSPLDLTHKFYAAAEAVGIPYNPDYNGTEQEGISPSQVTQRGGRRWSASDAFLRPAMKRGDNLEVVTGAKVHGLEWEGERVVGVRYSAGRLRKQETVARAARETIVCAGAIGSPQLLMVSGIGPAAHLEEHGVRVRHDLPGVGQNLHDHPYVVLVWDAHDNRSLLDAEKPKAMLEWLLRRSGPLSSPVAEALAFVRTRPDLPAADIEFHVAPAYFVEHGAATYEGNALTTGPTLLSPKSRGEVTLRSSDPFAKPRIQVNVLQEQEDVDSMVAGVELAREIGRSGPLAGVLGQELFPGEQIQGREAIEDDLRRRVELIYHPVGTCRMGSGGEAVLDPELRVRGVEGLRVVDASVFPTIPGGNTNAPTMMVAEKAADLIRGRGAAVESAREVASAV